MYRKRPWGVPKLHCKICGVPNLTSGVPNWTCTEVPSAVHALCPAWFLDTCQLFADPYLVFLPGCGLLSSVNSTFRDSDLPHAVAEHSYMSVRQLGTRFLHFRTVHCLCLSSKFQRHFEIFLFSQTWLRYVVRLANAMASCLLLSGSLSLVCLSVVCDVRAPRGFNFPGIFCTILAWPSGNSSTKNHEDRPRGSPPMQKNIVATVDTPKLSISIPCPDDFLTSITCPDKLLRSITRCELFNGGSTRLP